MGSPVIVAQNLVKWYGRHLALRNVSFAIDSGEVVGLLGPNGSGKSSIFRILTGYLPPTSGSAAVAGHDIWSEPARARAQVGYVPEDAPLYDHMRVVESLRFMARLNGVQRSDVDQAVGSTITRLRLEKVRTLLISKLSRGYRQRLAIAQALINDPKVLVLDEPTSGLDPSQVIIIRELIGELKGRHTVLIASHVLSEIEQIADRVMILLDGKLLTDNALAPTDAPVRIGIRTDGAEAVVKAALSHVPGILSVRSDPAREVPLPRHAPYYIVEAKPGHDLAAALSAAIVGRGLTLLELTPVRLGLEQVFLKLTRPAEEASA